MHTKTLVVVSVMMVLAALSILAMSARIESRASLDDENLVTTLNQEEGEEVLNTNGDESPVVAADNSDERRVLSNPVESEVLSGEEKFSGILEEVNVGCFADGECYVVVGGKHVTTMMGWTNATVGSVKGVEGFGDLEYFIGEEVSVYAGKKADGTYTLYQDEDYYVSLESASGASVALGKSVTIDGLKITPKKIIEDNRCPLGMMCIQAGTLILETEVEWAGKKEVVKTELGVEVKVGEKIVKLLRAEPLPEVGVEAENIFYFGVW